MEDGALNVMGTSRGDFYGADNAERTTSTPYKTVYTSTRYKVDRLEFLGCAVDETSSTMALSTDGSWFGKHTYMPYWREPVFTRPSMFGFHDTSRIEGGGTGSCDYSGCRIRMILAL